MIKFFASVALGLSVAGFASGLVAADDMTMTVKPGQRTMIYSYAMYDSEQCVSGQIPVGRVVGSPVGGRFEFVEERRTMDAGRCGRIQGWARNVYFTSAPGFRGTASGRVDFEYNKWTDAPAMTADTVTFTINVR